MSKRQHCYLRNICQVVVNLAGCETTESLGITNANFNIVLSHLSLEAFFQRENSCVHSILEFDAFTVPEIKRKISEAVEAQRTFSTFSIMNMYELFLQEGLSVDVVLAHGSGLPRVVGTAGITLEEVSAIVVPSADQQRNSEGTNSSGLSVLLHDIRNLEAERIDR